ncbi:MAG TPA: O-antigen ligase family protein [Acidobacteriaceae bacterium]|nr:O-antigen ligase family protein [Acidobacteriaceae bacterium]
MTLLATFITAGIIAGLFYLDREKHPRTSWALWIPVMWLLIVSSRPVSMWLHINREVTLADQYTEGSPLDAAYYGILIVAAGLVLNRRAAQVKQFLRVNLPVILFFAYCVASVAWSDDPTIAAKRCVKAVGDVLMVLVVLTDPEPDLAIRRMFARVGFVLLPMSILFIKYYPSMGTAYNPTDQVMMYFGVTTFKNLLGVLCMFSGLGALWSLIRAYQDRDLEYRSRHMIAQGAIVAMAVWLIVKADSMTSLSCFGLAGAVMVASAVPRIERSRGAVFGFVCGAVGFSLFALFVSTGSGLLHSIGRNSTLTGRTQIWAAVLAQHTNPLIGTGYESFWMGNRMQSVWDLSQVGIEEAHNGYLEMYLNLGWLGIALLGLLIVTGYRNAMTLFGKDPHAARLRLAFFTAGLIYSLTEAGFRMMSPTWIGFLLSVVAIPMLVPAVEREMPTPWKSRVKSEMRILR